MRRRLAEAARALLHRNDKIIDIALEFQFNSPEVFSRAFKHTFGLQPNQLRKQGGIDPRLLMPRLTPAHLRYIDDQGASSKPVIVERERMQFAGLMTLVKEDRGVIADLWEWLECELRQRMPCEKQTHYGIASYPTGWRQSGFFYMAAIELQHGDVPAHNLIVKTIPAARYVKVVNTGPALNLALSLDYIYHTWQPVSEERVSYEYVVERYHTQAPGVEIDVPLQ